MAIRIDKERVADMRQTVEDLKEALQIRPFKWPIPAYSLCEIIQAPAGVVDWGIPNILGFYKRLAEAGHFNHIYKPKGERFNELWIINETSGRALGVLARESRKMARIGSAITNYGSFCENTIMLQRSSSATPYCIGIRNKSEISLT